MSFLKNICFTTVFRWFPVLVIYVDFRTTFAGVALGPVVLIKPKYRDDDGLRAHELTHVEHSYIGLIIIHALLYKFSDRFRYWSELTCYRVQLGFSQPDQLDANAKKYARFIATKYDLDDVTMKRALTDLLTG